MHVLAMASLGSPLLLAALSTALATIPHSALIVSLALGHQPLVAVQLSLPQGEGREPEKPPELRLHVLLTVNAARLTSCVLINPPV